MTILQAVILGLIQGFSEFLPISSSGHLVIVERLLGLTQTSLVFDVGLHMATLLSVVLALWGETIQTARNFFSGVKTSLGLKILAATVPVGLVGIFFEDVIIENARAVWVVAISFIFWGVLLIAADIFARRVKQGNDALQKSSWKQVMAMGFVQAISLIPGTSRSGITMTAGLFAGMTRETSARVSFLLSIPAIAGAGLVGLKDVAQFGLDVPILALIVGMITAAVSGALCIKWLLGILKKHGFIGFGVYRIAIGIILLSWFL